MRPDSDHAPLPADWLHAHADDVYSQFGEDGLLEAILAQLPDKNHWCVEFGAWDGRHLSNTRRLIEQCGYHAVLIEGDQQKYADLCHHTASQPGVTPLQAYVGFTRADSLDTLLADTDVPFDFDVLSIDIDGNDYHVFQAIERYRPKVVVIEFNPTIPNEVHFVQEADPSVAEGCSILALDSLARSKSYELVATTRANALFVEARYFPLFGIQDNSINRLRRDNRDITYLFTGFNGRVFLAGNRRLPWHEIDYDASQLQLLPAWCHVFPSQANRWQRLYLKLRRHGALWRRRSRSPPTGRRRGEGGARSP